jgi:hypothetical protein
LIKQAKFTIVFIYNAIILPLLDLEDVSNIPMRKIAFYQLKECHIPQGLNQELQNLTFASLTPLVSKLCDSYMLTVALIIDIFICLEACCYATSTYENLIVTVPHS